MKRINHLKKHINNKRNVRKQSLYRLIIGISTFAVALIMFFSATMIAKAKEEKSLYKYYQSYMVEKDDTLYSIAKKMNDTVCSDKLIKECVDEMISVNKLDHKGTICYGNYIIVPYYSLEYK